MASQAPLFRQCIDTAVQASSRLVTSSVDDALAAMLEAERRGTTATERHELADAARELVRHRAAWIQRYPRELQVALQAAPRQGTPAFPGIGERLQALTLVEDDQIEQEIESSRLSEALQGLVAQPLAELDGLVSSLLGFPTVRPEQNPLRPDVFARILRAVMADTTRQPGWPALWTRYMAPTLGKELEQLYRRLCEMLTKADVHAAGYRVLPIRARSVPPAMPPPSPARSPGHPHERQARIGSGWADLTSHPGGDALIQHFLVHGATHGAALAPGYYARVATDLARLEATPDDEILAFDAGMAEHYARLPAVDRPLRSVSTEATLDRSQWGNYAVSRQRSLVRARLKKQARHADQVLGLEVVRKLVNQVAVDPRLLAPVRESIVALEPSLLRLAMVDPRFFSEQEHPGRRLLERVADRSLKFNDEFSTEFSDFSACVAAVFNRLNALAEGEVKDAAPFESALAELETSWAAQDKAEEAQRTAVLDAVRFAEERQTAADRIAWELSRRADLENVPEVVQDFVYRRWALVMAHARMTGRDRQIDPGGHGRVVTDLLWSVKPEVTLREPARLIEMVPGLLQRLRSGLAALGQSPREADSFFQALEQMHRPVLRLRARKRREDSDLAPLETESESEQPPPAARQAPKAVHFPWMGQRELDAAGFQDTLPTDHGELAHADGRRLEPMDDPAPSHGADSTHGELEVAVAKLREGCWVDLYSKRDWLRAQLVWASSRGTLFMFVSTGGQPHSMTRRSCERLLRERLLRPVDMHGAVSHAIDVLALAPDAPDSSGVQPLQSERLHFQAVDLLQ